MKAIVCLKHGSVDVLELAELPKPTPKDNQVLIKIHASTVTMGDSEMRRLLIPAPFKTFLRVSLALKNPKKILGQELAGEIEAVGKSVTKFKVGDKVFAPTDIALGAHAEYKCLPEKKPIGRIPANMNYHEAATIPTGGLNGLDFVKKAEIKSGDKLLINGAGGSIGTYATQIAKSMGAEVTCVDSIEKLEMLTSIGADYVIDYNAEDFRNSGETYDAIIDIVGSCKIADTMQSLSNGGRFIMGNPRIPETVKGLFVSKRNGKKAIAVLADYRQEDVDYLIELIEAGKIKAVIDKVYPLERMREAHQYVDSGKKKGNLVISI